MGKLMTRTTSRAFTALHARDLVVHLVGREFELRYRRSMLGWLWALAQPLLRLLILSFAFTRILNLDIPNYPVFLFSGLVMWQWFASGVSSATSCLVSRRDLLFRPRLPRVIVPIVSVLTDAIDFFIALPVLLLAVHLYVGLSIHVVLLPIVIVMQAMLILGIGLILSVANVYVRDVRLLVELVISFGFYLTPVFYDPDTIPSEFQLLIKLNPIARLMYLERAVLVFGEIPDLASAAYSAVMCVGVLALGLWIFSRTSHSVVDEL